MVDVNVGDCVAEEVSVKEKESVCDCDPEFDCEEDIVIVGLRVTLIDIVGDTVKVAETESVTDVVEVREPEIVCVRVCACEGDCEAVSEVDRVCDRV